MHTAYMLYETVLNSVLHIYSMDDVRPKSRNKDNYRSISLPEELVKLIEKTIVENPEYGYKSVSEFVKDAIRTKLSELERIRRFAKAFE